VSREAAVAKVHASSLPEDESRNKVAHEQHSGEALHAPDPDAQPSHEKELIFYFTTILQLAET